MGYKNEAPSLCSFSTGFWWRSLVILCNFHDYSISDCYCQGRFWFLYVGIQGVFRFLNYGIYCFWEGFWFLPFPGMTYTLLSHCGTPASSCRYLHSSITRGSKSSSRGMACLEIVAISYYSVLLLFFFLFENLNASCKQDSQYKSLPKHN